MIASRCCNGSCTSSGRRQASAAAPASSDSSASYSDWGGQRARRTRIPRSDNHPPVAQIEPIVHPEQPLDHLRGYGMHDALKKTTGKIYVSKSRPIRIRRCDSCGPRVDIERKTALRTSSTRAASVIRRNFRRTCSTRQGTSLNCVPFGGERSPNTKYLFFIATH